MNGIVIYASERYTVTSHLNGFAYTLKRLNDNADTFLQGDEAADFRAELERAEEVGGDCSDRCIGAYDHIMQVTA
jgi:hypothetical protein